MSINITKIGHAVLRVQDLDRSVAFYETLGLREVARRDFDGEHWVFLSSGNSHHDLALVEGGDGLHHVAFAIGDETEALSEAKQALDTAQIHVHGAMNFEVSQAIFVSDPDGHIVELYVDTPGEPWRADPALVANATPIELP